ncbi:MAG TPA: tetratricopeptide repeat protein, partial [Actinomycetota bacterium]
MQVEDIVSQALVQLNEMRASQPPAEILDKTLQVLDRFGPELGPGHRVMAGLHRLAAAVNEDLGRPQDATVHAAEAVAILRGHGAEARDELADVLYEAAENHMALGRYAEAEEGFADALDLYRSLYGDGDERVAYALSGLGRVDRHLGRYPEAEARLREVVDVWRRAHGPDDPDLGQMIGNVAEIRHSMHDYAGAEALYREALDLVRRAGEREDPRVGVLADNLGMLLGSMGRYPEAKPLVEEGLDIFRARYGEDHPHVAFSMANLAYLMREIGDLRGAETFHLQALAIRRKSLGEVHPDTATSYANLASLYDLLGERDAAEPMYRASLEVRRRVFGDEHPEVANSLNNLATFLRDGGDPDGARVLLEEALAIEVNSRGEDNERVATVLGNLAGLDERAGDLARAEERIRRALDIRRRVLGADHRDVALDLGTLAVLMAGTGREAEGLDLLREMVRIQDRQIGLLFGMGSERLRAGAVAYYEKGLDGFLSLVLRSFPGDPVAVRDALDLVLRRKALGAEALAVQREAVLGGRHPELRDRLSALTALRARIAQASLEGGSAEVEGWEQEKEKLEEELARAIPEMSLDRRLREADRIAVAAALPEGSALVELVRFDPHNFDAVGVGGAPAWLPSRYAAFVLPAGAPDDVTLVDLGEAEAIDRAIAVVRGLITGEDEGVSRGEAAAPGPAGGATAPEELRAAVWDPLLPALGDRTRVFLAPDGDLTRLPFEVLPAGSGWLVEERSLSYLASGRDVLRLGAEPVGAGPAVVAADPDFDLAGTAPVARAGAATRELDRSDLSFGRLPGTREEGRAVGAALGVDPWLEGDVLEGRI